MSALSVKVQWEPKELLAIVVKGKKRWVLRLKRELEMLDRRKGRLKTIVMTNHAVTLPVTIAKRLSSCRRSKREKLRRLTGRGLGRDAGGTAAESEGEGAEEGVRLPRPGGGAAFETSGLVVVCAEVMGEGKEPKPGGGAVADVGSGDVTEEVAEAFAAAAAAA